MIYCDELPFVALRTYHYLNIETMHIISFYFGEDDMDWEENIAETSDSKNLCDLLCAAHYE